MITFPRMATLRFFQDAGFDFETRTLLGHVYCGAADVGEILSTAARVQDGDAPSWVKAWQETARRIATVAARCDTLGHRVSARNAYLRAAVYYGAALTAVEGLAQPEKTLLPLFSTHRQCFNAYVSLLDSPAEHVHIPYEGSSLPGYFFRAPGEDPKPTLVLNNGSDGPITSLWPCKGLGAQARGYHVLAFDGPGQQRMLFERNVPFRPDWENVLTPVVDWLLQRPEVDEKRLALYGISQGGFWVSRALAFEHRFAAAIVDPGVVDVALPWLESLPKELLQLLEAGNREAFNQQMEEGMKAAPQRTRQTLRWRSKPYGTQAPFDTYQAVMQYRLGGLPKHIRTPLFIADPENESFWPGQPARLYQALPGAKELMPFTEKEGAAGHCEPMAPALLEQRMFDWLEDILQLQRGLLEGTPPPTELPI